MRKNWIVMTLLNAILWLPSTYGVDTCICAKVPMYPIPGGGGVWLHYAIVTDEACHDLYPTGSIEFPTPPEICGANCGTCASLPVTPPPPTPDFHFSGQPLAFDDINEVNEFKDFLKLHAGSFGPEYDNWDFTLRGVIALKRTVMNTDETFYAVVWKIVQKQSMGLKTFGFIGVEISEPGSGDVIAISSQHKAVHTMSSGHNLTNGLLQVQIKPGPYHKFDVAYIRLHDSPNNRNANYQPCPHPSVPKTEVKNADANPMKVPAKATPTTPNAAVPGTPTSFSVLSSRPGVRR